MSNGVTFSFGYGSLVNRGTHELSPIFPATIRGWRRRWCHKVDAPFGTVTSLSVMPDPAAQITGLILGTPDQVRHALDVREKGYDRHRIDPDAMCHDGPADAEVELYQSLRQGPGSAEAPILLSYIDTVMQGFQREFGADGVRAFLCETDGWDAPILRDRHAPRYPRATDISAAEAARHDDLLDGLGVMWQS